MAATILRQAISSWVLIMRASSIKGTLVVMLATPASAKAFSAMPSRPPTAIFSSSSPAAAQLLGDFTSEELRLVQGRIGARRTRQPAAGRAPFLNPGRLVGHLVKPTVVLVHDGWMVGKEQRVPSLRQGKANQPRQVADIRGVGLQKGGHAVLAHDLARPFGPLLAHAVHIQPLLPVGGVLAVGQPGRIDNLWRHSAPLSFSERWVGERPPW